MKRIILSVFLVAIGFHPLANGASFERPDSKKNNISKKEEVEIASLMNIGPDMLLWTGIPPKEVLQLMDEVAILDAKDITNDKMFLITKGKKFEDLVSEGKLSFTNNSCAKLFPSEPHVPGNLDLNKQFGCDSNLGNLTSPDQNQFFVYSISAGSCDNGTGFPPSSPVGSLNSSGNMTSVKGANGSSCHNGGGGNNSGENNNNSNGAMGDSLKKVVCSAGDAGSGGLALGNMEQREESSDSYTTPTMRARETIDRWINGVSSGIKNAYNNISGNMSSGRPVAPGTDLDKAVKANPYLISADPIGTLVVPQKSDCNSGVCNGTLYGEGGKTIEDKQVLEDYARAHSEKVVVQDQGKTKVIEGMNDKGDKGGKGTPNPMADGNHYVKLDKNLSPFDKNPTINPGNSDAQNSLPSSYNIAVVGAFVTGYLPDYANGLNNQLGKSGGAIDPGELDGSSGGILADTCSGIMGGAVTRFGPNGILSGGLCQRSEEGQGNNNCSGGIPMTTLLKAILDRSSGKPKTNPVGPRPSQNTAAQTATEVNTNISNNSLGTTIKNLPSSVQMNMKTNVPRGTATQQYNWKK